MKKIFIVFLFLFIASSAFAKCTGSPMNPVSDVRWNCILPITIAGVQIGGSGNALADQADNSIGSQSPVCVCMDNGIPRFGLTLGFREPIRIYETVRDPFCFPTFGFSIGNGSWGAGGDQGDASNTDEIYQYNHEIMFYPWKLMDLFTDVICMQPGGMADTALGIGDISEFYIHKKSEAASLIVNPDTLLFANPVAVLACIADGIATAGEFTLDPLFWCVGGTSQYPLAYFANKGRDQIMSAHINATKGIYTHHREGRLYGSIGNQGLCDMYYMPIWRKMQYRLQQIKPVPDVYCRRMGYPAQMWEFAKNPTMAGADNFANILWRKRDCCMF